MSAFLRFFFAFAFFVVVFNVADTVSGLPLDIAQVVSRSTPFNGYTGASEGASGGDVRPQSTPCSSGSCGGLPTLLNIFSNNAGNGGSSESGDVVNHAAPNAKKCPRNGIVPSSNGYSGTAGPANGGSSLAGSAPVNIFSNNAGSGGSTRTGTVDHEEC